MAYIRLNCYCQLKPAKERENPLLICKNQCSSSFTSDFDSSEFNLALPNPASPRVMELLKEKGAEDILVIGGGVIPDEDIESLKESSIQAIFTPGTSTSEIVEFIKNNVKK